eukprot:8414493-Alexandrium_andersonii.AAC.1
MCIVIKLLRICEAEGGLAAAAAAEPAPLTARKRKRLQKQARADRYKDADARTLGECKYKWCG